MSLSQEYRPVATSHGAAMGSHAIIHALLGTEDKTMCGSVDALDVVTMWNRVVNCGNCLVALKRERQRRSAEGTVRYQERMRRERQVAEHEADMVRVERQSLAESLADALYEIGYRHKGEHDYDPRGTEEWQAVVDAITGEER